MAPSDEKIRVFVAGFPPLGETRQQHTNGTAAPFNSGAWTFTYGLTGSKRKAFQITSKHRVSVCVSWTGVSPPVNVEAIYIELEIPARYGQRYSVRVSTSRGSFPARGVQSYEATFLPGPIGTNGSTCGLGATLSLRIEKSPPTPPVLRPPPPRPVPASTTRQTPSDPDRLRRNARRAFECQQSRGSADLRLYFPKTMHHIWTTMTWLSSVSTTIQSLSLRLNRRAYLPHVQPAHPLEPAFADSDDEADSLYGPGEESDILSGNRHFSQIIVDQFDFSTFSALLCWKKSQYIAFAPLVSTFHTSPETTTLSQARKKRRPKLHDDQDLPYKVSPKSIYRLAYHLGMSDLVELARDEFKSQLRVANVAEELVGHASVRYREIGNATVEYASERWQEVRASEGMRDVRRRANRGELGNGWEMIAEAAEAADQGYRGP